MSVQAHLPELRPPECNMKDNTIHCLEANGYKAVTLYAALCLVALGSGCLKPNIISHGADQFQRKDLRKLSSFFNAAYFAFSMGQLIALTLLVWVQTHSGMDVGFGVSAAVMAAGVISLVAGTNFYRNKPPRGSIFTPIAQVKYGIHCLCVFFFLNQLITTEDSPNVCVYILQIYKQILIL